MNRLSSILPEQLPEFVRADHPTFIAFLEAYYEFCEQQRGTIYTGRNNWDDIDNTLPEFLEFFYKDYLPLFPQDILSDKTLLAKNAKMFYRSKGTEKSFKLLFRALFNEDVEIYYPKNDILRVSAGKWVISVSLRLSPDDPTKFELFKNLTVTGKTSLTTALVDSTKIYNAFGTTVYELFVSNVIGDFLSSEDITATYINDDGTTVELTGRTLGIVSRVDIISGGANNNLGDLIPITGGGGIGASAYVSDVTTGQVIDVNIDNPGAGFRIGDQLVFTSAPGDNGSHAAAYVQSIESFNKQHPDSIYLNSDIIGGYSNVVLNAASFSANVSGRVTVASNDTTVYGSNTIFLSEVGPNVGISISGNTRLITAVVNNTVLTVNSAFSTLPITNANGVIVTTFTAANVNSTFHTGLSWNLRYGPSGPVKKIRVTNKGANYKSAPTANISGYVPMRNLGIIGAVGIANGGINYAVGDELTFTTVDGFGSGAAGYVTAVAANGAITSLVLAYPKITGWGNVASNTSNVLRGVGTLFTTDLTVGSVIVINDAERQVVNIANNTWLTTNTAFNFNGPQANVRIGVKDNFIGGILYNTSIYPPIINVSSVSGTNANLVLASTMAGGERLSANTKAGEIVGVTITNPGIGYTSNVSIDMRNNGDGTAVLVGDVIAGAYKYPGRYLDDTNLLNSASRIQDKDYYQNFSYVLKSKLSFNRYVDALKALVHPSGTKVFAQTLIESDHDVVNKPGFFIKTRSVPFFDFATGSFPNEITYSRASSGTNVNVSGTLITQGTDVPRLQYDANGGGILGFLVENQSTNYYKNSTFAGAVPGTPGTVPPFWTYLLMNSSIDPGTNDNVTRQIVGVGQEDGIDYIDLRLFGTPTANGVKYLDGITNTVAVANNDILTNSFYMRLMAGSFANTWIVYAGSGRSANGTGLLGPFYYLPPSYPTNASLKSQRYVITTPITPTPGISYFEPDLRFGYVVGNSVDFTIRFGLPQLEKILANSVSTSTAYASSPIRTSNGWSTRSVDIATTTSSEAIHSPVWIISATTCVGANTPNNNQPLYTVHDLSGSGNDYIQIRRDNTGVIKATCSRNNIVTVNLNLGAVAKNTSFKVAIRWEDGNVAASLNGGACVTSTANTTSKLAIGKIGGSYTAEKWEGIIKMIEFKQTVNNATLQTLSV